MELVSLLSGGAPVIKKYIAGTTLTVAGLPLLGAVDAATDLGSVEPPTASTVVGIGSQVGLSLDTTGTVAATGITDTDDILVNVIINPDLVMRGKMSGGAASDTALTIGTNTTEDTTGAATVGVTTFDNGAIWAFEGGNVGQFRRTADTSGTIAINFTNTIAVGDRFLAVHGFPCSVELTAFESFDLTTELDQIRAELAIIDMDNFSTVDMELNDVSSDGNVNSFYHLIANNHLFNSSSLA